MNFGRVKFIKGDGLQQQPQQNQQVIPQTKPVQPQEQNEQQSETKQFQSQTNPSDVVNRIKQDKPKGMFNDLRDQVDETKKVKVFSGLHHTALPRRRDPNAPATPRRRSVTPTQPTVTFKANPDKYKQAFESHVALISKDPKVLQNVQKVIEAINKQDPKVMPLIEKIESGQPVYIEEVRKMLNDIGVPNIFKFAPNDPNKIIYRTLGNIANVYSDVTKWGVWKDGVLKGEFNSEQEAKTGLETLKTQDPSGGKWEINKAVWPKEVDVSGQTRDMGINKENWNTWIQYLGDSLKTVERFKDKNISPFDYKIKFFQDPKEQMMLKGSPANWRATSPGHFRVDLEPGFVTPGSPDVLQNKMLNHFFNFPMAWAMISEVVTPDGKKIWLVDEKQSDVVQKVSQISDEPQPKTPGNPEGKSDRQLYKSKIENYYADWKEVLFNEILKKGKELGVDEVRLISRGAIMEQWSQENVSDPEELEKNKQMWNKIYENLGVRYSGHPEDETVNQMKQQYKNITTQLSEYFRMQSTLKKYENDVKEKKELENKYNDLKSETAFKDLDEQLTKYFSNPEEYLKSQPDQKLPSDINQAIDIKNQLKKIENRMVGQNIEEIKQKFDAINYQDLDKEKEKIVRQLVKHEEKPGDAQTYSPDIYPGEYYVIDMNTLDDKVLARRTTNTMVKVGTKSSVDVNQKAEEIYNWIVNTWLVNYTRFITDTKFRQQFGVNEKDVPAIQRNVNDPNLWQQLGFSTYWQYNMESELRTDSNFLAEVRRLLREKFNNPEFDLHKGARIYIKGNKWWSFEKKAVDNPDPSVEDNQRSPMEEDMVNRSVNPQEVLYRGRKGLGKPMGNPGGEDNGELKCNLPAGLKMKMTTASDIVKRIKRK